MSLTAKLVALGLILLALAAGGWKVIHSAEKRGYERARAEYTEARILADRAQRTEEQRRTAAVTKEAADATIRISELEADLRSARSGADRLRNAATAAARRAGPRPATATAGPGEPDTDALDLLVGVLDRHSRELVEIGEFADRLRIAGRACEASYDRLQPAGK